MTQPVYTVAPEASVQKKATVNLLPCRIHHDGDANPSNMFWSPDQAEDGTNTAYLRGRKLHGKLVKLPQGYYGSVVEKSEAKPEPSRHEVAEDATPQEEPEDQLQVGAMQGKAAFDEMMIWDHESSADSSADPYVRSMEEWVTFTEQMHAYPTEPESPSE